MKTELEPFSTHRPWDALTTQAYHDQPQRDGKHYPLGDHCSESMKADWREWARKYPDHWPSHVRRYAEEQKRIKERANAEGV